MKNMYTFIETFIIVTFNVLKGQFLYTYVIGMIAQINIFSTYTEKIINYLF
jgi:hypothetical protein